MKLYNGTAPNPRRVRIFIAEKGIEVSRVDLDLQKGEQQAPQFRRLNSLAKVPVLELDDGTPITESVAICRYLEELHPNPSLFGSDPLSRARIEMWNRRMEIEILTTCGSVAVHTLAFFKERVRQIPAYAEAQRAEMQEKWAWLDRELADGRPFVAGDSFSVADITGMTASMLAGYVELPIPASLSNLRRWDERMRARPSWNA